MQAQVQAIQEESSKLQAAYAGDKAMEITNREREVVRAWLEIQNVGDSRKSKLNDTSDLFKFFAMVRNLVLWMDDLMRQMKTSEKPRDVSGVELLMNNHQGMYIFSFKNSQLKFEQNRQSKFSMFTSVYRKYCIEIAEQCSAISIQYLLWLVCATFSWVEMVIIF